MRRFLVVLAVLAAAAPAAPARAADEARAGFVELFKQASEAHAAKDYARMEQTLREALKLRPAHPAALYNFAAARALQGQKESALKALAALADMGLAYAPASDEDFASLRADRDFTDITREFARNRAPTGGASETFRLRSPTFIPEGIAYDERRSAFYVGSVHERRIQRIRGRSEADFVAPAAGGLWAPLGMVADRRRHRLWVATAAIPEMRDADPKELGQSAILAYDLDTGEPKQRFVLPADGREHALGDLIVLRDGKIYATDSKAGLLYGLDPETGKFEALTRLGQLTSPQGLALSRNREKIFIADYTQGLFRYDIDKKALTRLEVDPGICVYGIDGLYFHEGDLIAVQNGIRPHRVVRFTLEAGGARVQHARVLAANLPDMDEPTLGVVVDHRFYFVANSQRNRFGKDHTLPPAAELKAPVVLRLTLEGSEPGEERGQRGPGQPAPQSQPPLLPPIGVPPLR